LTGIDVAADNLHFSSLDGVLFNKVQNTLVGYPGGKAGSSYIIPESVETIGYGAFTYCIGLTSVTIPNSVTAIGEGAFDNCIELTSVAIPNSVIAIGNYAFSYCSKLTSVTIGNAVKTIGNYAFSRCSSLTGTLTIPNSVTAIGKYAFTYCIGLTSVTIGNSVKTIGERAFYECTKLALVTIGNSVETIGDYAFSDCSGLTGTLTIPNSVTAIGSYAFRYCSGLTSVTIGNSVKTIGEGAFVDCTKLASVTIGNSVETIGEATFYECSGLKTIYVKAITPPVVLNVFHNVPTDIPVHVPCGRASAYQSVAEWSWFTNYIDDLPLFNLIVQSEDINKGTASIAQANTCTNNAAIITATPLTGYLFKQWSDGNTDNPRILIVTQDTVLTAIFESISGIDGTQATALALYPNPVRDELFISGVSGDAMIVITDLSGRTVETWYAVSLQTGEISINLSHLAKGVYLVRIGNVTGKIVKE
jgi:hypothetical protein